MGYKSLSLIQAVFILLAAFSVLDFAYSASRTGNLASAGDGLFFNKLLFDQNEGILSFLYDNDVTKDWWGIFHFWAYSFFIVGIIQLLKAFTVKT